MERIESNRKDCFLYVKDNYLYKLNKTVNGIRYLKCKKRFCKSTVKFKEGDVYAEVYPSEHNHEPNRTEVEILMLRSELRLTARSDIRPPRQIFEDVIRNYPLGAKSIGFPSVRTLIYKTRENSRPPIPICLEEYAEILNSENWCMYGLSKDTPPQLFFRKLLVDDQNNYEAIAVVFASFKVTSVMKSVVKTIHIDISTRTVPILVGVTQLLTIHIVIKKYIFPAVYVLMKDKTKRNYKIIFEYVCNEICPEFIPENVVTDLDEPLREILLYLWPTTKLVGFFFYYAQAIFRECRNFRMQMLLKNSIAARKVTRMLMALNLIPKSLLENALHYIKSYLKCNELSKQFVSLMVYVQNYWFNLSGPSSFSICTTTNCINDALKNFNTQMLTKMGPNPSVWIFTEKLREIEHYYQEDLLKILSGFPHIRKHNTKMETLDRKINETTKLLLKKELSMGKFLEKMCQTVCQMERAVSENLREEVLVQIEKRKRKNSLVKPLEILNEMNDLKHINVEEMDQDLLDDKEEYFKIESNNSYDDLNNAININEDDKKTDGKKINIKTPDLFLVSNTSDTSNVIVLRNEATFCVFCKVKHNDTVIIPCGHKCVCNECGGKLVEKNRTCPICNNVVTMSVKVLESGAVN